jgi:hypothetical protein
MTQGRANKDRAEDEQQVPLVIEISPTEGQDTQKRVRATRLPAVIPGRQTRLPGTASFEVITSSFGASIDKQPSLWSEEDSFELITPQGLLRIKGSTHKEHTTLQQYVAHDLAPDGLKILAGFLEVYDLLTQGRDQKQDVQVTARQVLQRIGRGAHADDRDEQMLVLQTALYLARSAAVVTLVQSQSKRYTPLLMLESWTIPEIGDGSIALEYHLGQEFFEALYGKKPQRYTIPTAHVMGYHGVKSQQELLLTFYLGNRLAQGKGTRSLYFVTLCVQSALYSVAELQPGEAGKNRTRNAQQVIYALERLEQDGLIVRDAHEDVDLVLAATCCLEPTKERLLAASTRTRLKGLLRSLKDEAEKSLVGKRREALQRLLNVAMSREDLPEDLPGYCTRLTFHAGPLLVEKQALLPQRT